MKRIFLFFVPILALFASCNDSIDNPGFATEAEAVSFYVPSDGQYVITESDGLHEIAVVRTLVSDAAVTVNYSIEEIGATSADYSFISERGSVQIPSNQASGLIIFETFNNIVGGEDDKIIRLTITDISSGLELDDSDGRVTTMDIVLVDDDCPVDAASFAGTYSVAEVFTSGVNEGLTLAGVFGEFYEMVISADPADATNTRLIFDNNAGANEYLPDGTGATLDACSGNVVFDSGAPLVALFANFSITEATFDDSGFVIQADGTLGNFGPYQFIFTKQ